MKNRFSKENVKALINERIAQLELVNDFDPMNGYEQVNGKGEELNRAYGEYDALRSIYSELFD